jgi:hypothetical protein
MYGSAAEQVLGDCELLAVANFAYHSVLTTSFEGKRSRQSDAA